MNVLVAGFDGEGSGFPFGSDFFEAGDDGGRFFFGEDADFGGGFGVGDGAADVLGPHSVGGLRMLEKKLRR